ncbi:hypothetical protein SUGI_0475480 [Cryptomeria japonica]|uniref:uncharacterized protein LOC131043442 n=1 Tax=Cryptomeria japonica TaxID=3369 RepID=UPI002408B8B2|nr:uncharacterized protein LOC131043442 [Cryptomeria japonica]GLJ24863.1 hypothetical protein SUGI_0475480 [Cryptomeria japonica]
MGKSVEKEFQRTLTNCTQAIDRTFMLLNEAATGLEKVPWTDVKKSAEQVSKQATTAGFLWSSQQLKLATGQENIKAFCDSLHGFLLLCHGSTVGAGPTLRNAIQLSAKQVVDSSLQFINKAISVTGAQDAERKTVIPQFVGRVWEASNSLAKTPTSNSIAIGRNLAQVAASVKDVIREMGDLKESEIRLENGLAGNVSEIRTDGVEGQSDGESTCSLEIDDRLSPEEMEIAKSVKDFVSLILVVLKEILYAITGMSQCLKENDTIYLHPLERILELCQEMSIQVDEVGACCYPPQEVQKIRASTQKIWDFIDGLCLELQKIDGSSLDGFMLATGKLEKSLATLKTILDASDSGKAEGEN